MHLERTDRTIIFLEYLHSIKNNLYTVPSLCTHKAVPLIVVSRTRLATDSMFSIYILSIQGVSR